MASVLGILTNQIQAVCPIDGIAAGPNTPKEEWVVWYKDESTIEQKAAAQAIIDAFDWGAAQAAIDARVQSFHDDVMRSERLEQLRTALPSQIDSWVDANITTLVQARELLKGILKVLASGV